jgi:cyclopropane fatty-acyl-phospholipid synthase-like methyltransferase
MADSKVKQWFHDFFEDCWFAPDHVRLPEVDFVWRALKLRKGTAVLDIPCGDGQMAIHLARRGCKVVGIDLQPRFIRRARMRFKKEGLPGLFRCEDMRELPEVGRYGAVCNWFNSFGYFSDKENLETLVRFARALKRGGRLLITQNNRAAYLRKFAKANNTIFEDGNIRKQVIWDDQAKRFRSTFTRIIDGATQTCGIEHRLYSRREFERLFQSAGLEIDNIYGEVDLRPYNQHSRRILVVGIKR